MTILFRVHGLLAPKELRTELNIFVFILFILHYIIIEEVVKDKHLGITFNSRITWSNLIIEVRTQSNRKLANISKMIYML